jgi:hypothetical protein
LKFFDENGKGFDEMTGWYLCDGRNGAPDLSGRVATGRTRDLSHYRIGDHGGNDTVQLSLDQMPHHTHIGIILHLLLLIKLYNIYLFIR